MPKYVVLQIRGVAMGLRPLHMLNCSTSLSRFFLMVPIELTFEVPATAQTTPARSREFTPSPFVQSIQNMQPESSVFNTHLAQPSAAIVQQPVQSGKLAQLGQDLQSEQLMQMGMQEGYDGPCNGLPPHPQMQSTGLPLQSSASSPLPPPMTMLQPPPEQVTDVLPHVPANLQDDGSGELPRLPDEAVEGTVLGLVHLELAFVLDGVVGGWVCRMCLQRKEEVDDTFPVPVYPSSSEDTMSDDMRGVMSTHCAQTHWDAFSCISQWSEEEAREELREMLEE